MASNRARRIAKELADINSDQHSQIVVDPAGSGEDLTHLLGQFFGPPDTPYEGAKYLVDIKIPADYPFRPPNMRFETKIWHPNVSSQTVRTAFKARMLLLKPPGRHLSRHTLLAMVTRPHDQKRPHLASVSPQHTRAQRPTGCRSCQHANPKSGRV